MAVTRSSCRLSQSDNSKSPIGRSVMTYLAYPIYGGAHLAVWNAHFPSNVERILWIASALSIMVLPPLQDVLKTSAKWIWRLFLIGAGVLGTCLMLWLGKWFVKRTFKKFRSWKGIKGLLSGKGIPWSLLKCLPGAIKAAINVLRSSRDSSGWVSKLPSISQIGITCWVLARAYLLVESLVSIRSLPLGSHNAVNWVSYIPHL